MHSDTTAGIPGAYIRRSLGARGALQLSRLTVISFLAACNQLCTLQDDISSNKYTVKVN